MPVVTLFINGYILPKPFRVWRSVLLQGVWPHSGQYMATVFLLLLCLRVRDAPPGTDAMREMLCGRAVTYGPRSCPLGIHTLNVDAGAMIEDLKRLHT